MSKKRVAVLGFVLAFLMYTFSANAASDDAAANQPWKIELLKNGVDSGVKNVSTAFGGDNDIPMLSWNIDQVIYHALPETPFLTGNCGPDNSWRCYGVGAASGENVVGGTVSPMASLHLSTTYLVGWAYKTDTNKIQGVIYEYSDEGEYLTRHWVDLLDLNKFGAILVGTPSIEIVGEHFQAAVTVNNGGDFPTYKLVYVHRTGTTNTSCIDAGSAYQCDVIELSVAPADIGAPSMDMDDSGVVGIAYFKNGEGLKYAYPHITIGPWTANCGPDPKAWRCISIFGASGTVSKEVKLDIGETGSARGVAFTYDDTLIDNTLYLAEYVGSGGNCGVDKNIIGATVYKWQCTDIDILAHVTTPSYSIEVDPEGYAVVAYDNALSELSPINLYLTYSNARVGVPTPGWIREEIDGAPLTTIRTGAKVALSLNGAGIGLVGYLQEEDYQLPDVKIARQYFTTYLPLIRK